MFIALVAIVAARHEARGRARRHSSFCRDRPESLAIAARRRPYGARPLRNASAAGGLVGALLHNRVNSGGLTVVLGILLVFAGFM